MRAMPNAGRTEQGHPRKVKVKHAGECIFDGREAKIVAATSFEGRNIVCNKVLGAKHLLDGRPIVHFDQRRELMLQFAAASMRKATTT